MCAYCCNYTGKYRIVGNLQGRKLLHIGKREYFSEKTSGMQKSIIDEYGMPKFHGENLSDGSKIAKFVSFLPQKVSGIQYLKATGINV